jgi:hypothetical protein
MDKDTALSLAFEALKDRSSLMKWQKAITAVEAALEANEFNPDWDTQAVLVEEIQRMAKRIEELEAKDEPVAWKCVCGANLYIDENGVPTSKGEA